MIFASTPSCTFLIDEGQLELVEGSIECQISIVVGLHPWGDSTMEGLLMLESSSLILVVIVIDEAHVCGTRLLARNCCGSRDGRCDCEICDE